VLIEWAEKIKAYLPPNKWVIIISIIDEFTRMLEFSKK